jgi:hypothetical protein
MLYDLSKATGRLLSTKRKAASDTPDAALANAILGPLECEINPSANHAKVVMRPVHKIPAEITDPANVWG